MHDQNQAALRPSVVFVQIPYVMVRGNSDNLYKPIQKFTNGTWGYAMITCALQTHVTARDLQFCIARITNVDYSMLVCVPGELLT